MNDISANSITFTIKRSCMKDYFTKCSECDVYCRGTVMNKCDTQDNTICQKG